MSSVIMYTDGTVLTNPGPGGYAAVLICRGLRKQLSGGFVRSTGNRMKLTALIEGLAALKSPCEVTLFCDNPAIVRALGQNWIAEWRRRSWRTSNRQPVRNRDLWETLDDLLKCHRVTPCLPRDQSTLNETTYCGSLALLAAQSRYRKRDDGFDAAFGSEPSPAQIENSTDMAGSVHSPETTEEFAFMRHLPGGQLCAH